MIYICPCVTHSARSSWSSGYLAWRLTGSEDVDCGLEGVVRWYFRVASWHVAVSCPAQQLLGGQEGSLVSLLVLERTVQDGM